MEPFTGGLVTAEQRKAYLVTHPWMRDAYKYRGHGKYLMIAWQSQITYCRATTEGSNARLWNEARGESK